MLHHSKARTHAVALLTTVVLTGALVACGVPTDSASLDANGSTTDEAVATPTVLTMPDVVGMNLQVAQDKLQGIGLFVLDQEDATGQGRLQINDDNWTVCRQQPPAGDTVNPTDQITVWSVKDGELCDAEAQPAATDSTAPAQGSAGSTDDAPTPVDVTVDQLVDMINAGGPGRPGDRFHFTGTLVGRDHWYVGVTGEYSVLVETTQGSDLLVFIDKSETATWRDGMRVDMIVENVEREINGETEAGWIKAVSATIVG